MSALADFVMPRPCIVCGTELGMDERHICRECFSDMPLARFAGMKRNPMSDRFNAGMNIDEYEPYAYAAALFYYAKDNGYSHITQALKYHRNFSAGRAFSSMLASELSLSPLFSDVDAVVPVPLHWIRQWKRGYNQAAVIAGAVSSELKCPCYPDMLRRIHNTTSQTRLDMQSKESNVRHAFAISKSYLKRHPALHHILLVDDVFTSGATMRACYSALRGLYPAKVRISIATLGFVEKG